MLKTQTTPKMRAFFSKIFKIIIDKQKLFDKKRILIMNYKKYCFKRIIRYYCFEELNCNAKCLSRFSFCVISPNVNSLT